MNPCVIVFGGERKLREKQVAKLRATADNLLPSLEKVEQEMQSLNEDAESDRELRRLARSLYVGQSIEEKILEGDTKRISVPTLKPCRIRRLRSPEKFAELLAKTAVSW